jgi:long-chain fatty acid transport protein
MKTMTYLEATPRLKRLIIAAFCGIALLFTAQVSWAGGLYLNEFGTTSMGTAGAGAGALAMDASTAFHNAAGMTRLEGNQLMASAGLLYADIQFDPSPTTPIPGNDGGSAGGPGPILGMFYSHSLTEKWKLGVSLVSISAALMDFDDGWTGRYYVKEVSILTLSVLPAIAYKVNDCLSLGATGNIMYGKLEEKIAAPPPDGTGEVEIDGDDTEFGFSFSALVEPSDRTRIGIVYASEATPNFDGDISVKPPGLKTGIDATITFPQLVKASVYHEFSDQLAVVGSVGWEQWSAFENITLSVEQGSKVLPRNWKDTWYFGAGLHYRPTKEWLLMAGASYNTSPVDDEDRTIDMPIDRQVRLSCGAQYAFSERFTLGGYFTYADYGKAKIEQPLLQGDFQSNDLYFVALSGSWKF